MAYDIQSRLLSFIKFKLYTVLHSTRCHGMPSVFLIFPVKDQTLSLFLGYPFIFPLPLWDESMKIKGECQNKGGENKGANTVYVARIIVEWHHKFRQYLKKSPTLQGLLFQQINVKDFRSTYGKVTTCY